MRSILYTTFGIALLNGCGSGNSSPTPDTRPAAPQEQSIMESDRFEVISPVPDAVVKAYKLDRDYYAKYIDVWGIPVLGPETVSSVLLKNAAEIVAHQLSDDNLQAGMGPLIREALYDRHFRVVIFPKQPDGYGSTLVPEYRNFPDEAGYGATPEVPLTGINSKALVYMGDWPNPQSGNTLVHELTHSIHLLTLDTLVPDFEAQLANAYQHAQAENLWSGTGMGYINTNRFEYLAVGSELWNNVRAHEALSSRPESMSLRQHLQDNDPALYNLLSLIYSDEHHLTEQLTIYRGYHTLTVELTDADYPIALDLNQVNSQLYSAGERFYVSKITNEQVRDLAEARYAYGFSARFPGHDLDIDLFIPDLNQRHGDYVMQEYRFRLTQLDTVLADCSFTRQELLSYADSEGRIRLADPISCQLSR
ncbi:hypothetical protein [Ferrimonas aestuarii]|uniref:Uncharacterized protein n=1 Tax=Ferrimonas aestuarii TaxID=2569539 RepID=A0A4U1BT46_9GAMM|nr:hypothetical protein [Ferrimonas aestuarii]TKB58319.1 hypothetical protein FCL42_00780 [Ferrimonas aestuarii]